MRRADYKGLKCLADVRAERRMIDSEIDNVKGRLEDNYRRADYFFSLENLTEYAVKKFSAVYNLVDMVYRGYEFALSVIDKLKEKKRRD